MLYLGSAGGVWAEKTKVAQGVTGMSTFWSWLRAGLLTLPFSLTITTVAYFLTEVQATGQGFITDQATGDILQVTWYITPLL